MQVSGVGIELHRRRGMQINRDELVQALADAARQARLVALRCALEGACEPGYGCSMRWHTMRNPMHR